MAKGKRTGIVFINVGTPDSPHPKAVGKYLREFLMDPHVVDIPFLARWFLVHGLIVPRRSHQSAALYQKIWTPTGSPLLSHTLALAQKVQEKLADTHLVLPAMRYGNPSLRSAVEKFREAGISELIAFPLYPQYSLAATHTSLEALRAWVKRLLPGVGFFKIPPFYSHPCYLDAVVQVSRPYLGKQDKVLFSFHGLPERQVKKTAPEKCFVSSSCCERVENANENCYRAQSFFTAREVAKRLGLEKNWEVGFQSRLGRTPWIQPFSDKLYETLPQQGVKNLAVLTPSFVADCLETLEEVQMRGEEAFRQAGGEKLVLVPSLNSHPAWVEAATEILKTALPA